MASSGFSFEDVAAVSTLVIKVAKALDEMTSSSQKFGGDTAQIGQRSMEVRHSFIQRESQLRSKTMGILLKGIPQVQCTPREMAMNMLREMTVECEIVMERTIYLRQSSRFPRQEYEELSRSIDILEGKNRVLHATAPLPFYSHNVDLPGYSNATFSHLSQGDPTTMKLGDLFNECLAGLALLSHVSPEHALLATLQNRFKQWGSDHFEGPVSLDAVLDIDASPQTKLQDVLTRALVYIAVIEGHLFIRSEERDEGIKQRLLDQLSKTIALLGRGPPTEIALECFAGISPDIRGDASQSAPAKSQQPAHSSNYSRQGGTGVASDAASTEDFRATHLKGLERQTRELQIEARNCSNNLQGSETHGLKGAQDSLDLTGDVIWKPSHIIDLLFDLTPSIRYFQRTYIPRQEAMTTTPKDLNVQAAKSEEPPRRSFDSEMTAVALQGASRSSLDSEMTAVEAVRDANFSTGERISRFRESFD